MEDEDKDSEEEKDNDSYLKERNKMVKKGNLTYECNRKEYSEL